ncbi:two-component system alkaline phosphatase synthesis response regulator PhoP [Breznakia sp. PF5-3]|uniref:response regulator transcription factor n=1 Tax=unclassified Breznakia TaxID=2623764 RepID=UPI002404AC28|nr:MULTISPECIES: response regulator transcription factor [unclassified Breznakia]MDF9825095.1 two-component system alkaline phosphatase synthesis response regulator PhoP [Breznakia sp. PM6-1]MDF9835928.1 two-component system alkaline phosphatase synthesis response regulator PhoP [Breznakia sp. PF5-3]MDF9837470.1 two-component system alkaline phosphatase synthesis response regulator PhoP [Breznakia sp. PFB2-8]MDF9859467.1 two-component system alkaline phosphatase synthesis response regulator Pho
MKKILIIEDEASIRKLVAYDLKQVGYDVYEAEDGLQAKEMIENDTYDLLLIDWMIPHISGIELVKHFRARDVHSVFIMLTAKDEEENILEAFEAGVDDYVSKPFSPRVLLARINSHLKNKESTSSNVFADLEIDEKKRKVMIGNEELILTKKEYDLLCYFIMNANIVLSRDQILNDIWGFDYDGDTRIVDVHTFKLRSKLKESQVEINSSRGVGYILEEKNEERKD